MITLLAALAFAAQDDAERLRRLEEQVRQQQAEIDELRSLTFRDGLRWRGRDDAFDVHLGGRFEEQYRHVFSRPDASRTSPDTFYVREAFLQADGTLYREFGFRVNGDFTSSAGGPVANLEEAYLEWKRWDGFALRFGQFKSPNSQEILTSTLFTDCIERSILSRFVPDIELGIQAAGQVGNGILGYQVAVINGRSQPSGPGRSTNDSNDEKDLLVRLTTMPFIGDPELLIRQLRLGVYGSIGDVDEEPMATQFDVTSRGLGVTFLDSTAGLLNGRRWRAGAELSYVIGPASFRGEALLRRDAINDAADAIEEKLTTRAWYGQVTVILFGAEKVTEARLTPARPFDPLEGQWGALEVVFRAAGGRVGGTEYGAVGNSLAGQSNSLLEYTAGFNWYPVKNVRLSVNGILEDYRDRIDFGNGVLRSSLSGLLFRFQVDF